MAERAQLDNKGFSSSRNKEDFWSSKEVKHNNKAEQQVSNKNVSFKDPSSRNRIVPWNHSLKD